MLVKVVSFWRETQIGWQMGRDTIWTTNPEIPFTKFERKMAKAQCVHYTGIYFTRFSTSLDMPVDEILPEVPNRKLRSDTNNVQNQGSDDDSDNEYFVIQTVPKICDIPSSLMMYIQTEQINSSPDGTIAQSAIVDSNVDDSADTTWITVRIQGGSSTQYGFKPSGAGFWGTGGGGFE